MNISENIALCNPFELPSVSLLHKSKLPQLPGLYFVIHLGSVLYVGKANNIAKRWQNHQLNNQLKKLSLLKNADVQIAWLSHPNDFSLVTLEQAAISSFQPKFNATNKSCSTAVEDLRVLPENASPIDLCGRYNISRSGIYCRMNILKIKAKKIGNRAYLDSEQIKQLDEFHSHPYQKKKEGNQSAEPVLAMDLELKAMSEISSAFSLLDQQTIERVLRWASDRYLG